MTGWRNPARYVAPLAIGAVAAASYVIVHHAVMHKHASASLSIVQSSTTSHSRTTHRISTKGKFYVVRPNDTMSKIAARTGVSLATLKLLNPNVNPDALQPQQRLRLRR
ncbi:MAG TPA: LysM domain-containing protein [Solirubrobacteraceae bacterium]|nr:LysM domain-containing protein [Solirubrobacteraceae bacterium]